jgi:hypothetical protein
MCETIQLIGIRMFMIILSLLSPVNHSLQKAVGRKEDQHAPGNHRGILFQHLHSFHTTLWSIHTSLWSTYTAMHSFHSTTAAKTLCAQFLYILFMLVNLIPRFTRDPTPFDVHLRHCIPRNDQSGRCFLSICALYMCSICAHGVLNTGFLVCKSVTCHHNT